MTTPKSIIKELNGAWGAPPQGGETLRPIIAERLKRDVSIGEVWDGLLEHARDYFRANQRSRK
jgi:hypothetical protein